VAIRVVIAEDSLLMREGIEKLLAPSGTIDVVASVGDMAALLTAVERSRPQVVVTDIRMPPTHTTEGIEVAARLRQSDPDVGVVVLSQYSDPSYAVRVFETGSDGRAYLLKERVHRRQDLVEAIEAVAEGRSVIDPKIVEVLIAAGTRAPRSAVSRLSPRELEILAAMAQGKSNTAIAQSFRLTKRAVEKHITAIFSKLGFVDPAEGEAISKRVAAVLMFLADAPASP
jgi:DNA-binding NarL/FixJ family response regulator